MKKSKKAQQLVEFALVMPILIMIFMFIIEIGFTINARLALAEAVKISLNKANQLVGSSQTDIKDALETSIKNYISSHNLPDSNSISVEIFEPAAGEGEETALIKVNYKYHPIFNILNFSGQNVIPSEFNFSSYQVINAAILKPNNYTSFFSSADLTSFSKDSSILKDQNINGMDFRNQVAFLVGFDTAGGSDYDFARLFNWWGEDLLPPNLALNIQGGTLEVKSPYYNSGNWTDTKIPYTWVLTSLGFTHAIYSRVNNNADFTNYKLNLSSVTPALNLAIPLYGQPGCISCGSGDFSDLFSGDMSDSSLDNLNKRAFNMHLDNTQSPFGSFDVIKSLSGSASLQTNNNYTFNNGNYVLKLFIPCNSKPNDDYNGYNYKFNLTGGIYTGIASPNTDIIDCYIDNDGDSIPNAWDNDPEYPDIDGDGNFDGEQANIVSIVKDPILPDQIDTSQAGIVTSEFGTLNIATPFDIDGFINSSIKIDINLKSFTPKEYTINFLKYSSGSYNAIYFLKNGTIYTRKTTGWSSLADKSNFINGTISSGTFDLNKSKELDTLDNGAFSSSNKVGH